MPRLEQRHTDLPYAEPRSSDWVWMIHNCRPGERQERTRTSLCKWGHFHIPDRVHQELMRVERHARVIELGSDLINLTRLLELPNSFICADIRHLLSRDVQSIQP